MRVGICLLVLFISGYEGVIFKRCNLATELLKFKGIKKEWLGSLVCLVEQVSKKDTSTFVVTPSGKKFYGLYQIPSRWCREGRRGGDCNIRCELLLDDDIRDDTACVLKILDGEGFKYWPKWTDRCKNKIKFITEEIYKCPDLSSPRSSPDRMLSRHHYRSKRETYIRKRRWRLLNFYNNMEKR